MSHSSFYLIVTYQFLQLISVDDNVQAADLCQAELRPIDAGKANLQGTGGDQHYDLKKKKTAKQKWRRNFYFTYTRHIKYYNIEIVLLRSKSSVFQLKHAQSADVFAHKA